MKILSSQVLITYPDNVHKATAVYIHNQSPSYETVVRRDSNYNIIGDFSIPPESTTICLKNATDTFETGTFDAYATKIAYSHMMPSSSNIRVLGSEVALPSTSGAATSFSEASVVRIVNTDTQVAALSIKDGYSITMPAKEIIFLEKLNTQLIYGNTGNGMKGVKVGFTH
tara:strand:+ start:232 stop:741 length:510 start_codon:yes stop_codon:yes gene_type:complete